MEHHRYNRPPPPSDPYQRPPPPSDPYQRPPLPPNHNQPWNSSYSTPPQQFQYQPHHSPSPPPPPQWPPAEHAQYPPPPPYGHHPPPPPPYSGNPHYPPPRPQYLHQPPYPPQDYGNGSWSQHQSWQYPNNSNEEDWAAKARAWAAANTATDNQQPQPQIVAASRPEGHHHFQNQFSQSYDPQFSDAHRQLPPVSSYEQYPAEMGSTNGPGLGQSQGTHYPSSGQSSYVADMHVSYAAPGGSSTGNSTAPFPQHDKSSMNSSVHQQEVPYSYSSVAGNDAGNRYEEFNSSSSRPVFQHLGQPIASASGRSRWMEEPDHLSGSHPAQTVPDLSDQPLSFAPHFNHNLDQHEQPNYTHSSGGTAQSVDPTANSSNYAWPSTPGVFYPPVTAKMTSGPQADHLVATPSSASGHPTMFSNGPGFQPNPPIASAAFGVGSGVTPHPTAFSGDAYGVSGISERPKKASVPNWLREEIIKNKAVITSSALEASREDSESVEDDINDRFSRRDEADNRSIGSSRLVEDENDDEEEVEAARTAAINQEIKRILTEVLLKVTDELFDEIATKVLNEDDLSIEVGNDVDLSNDKVIPSMQAALTPKASARVMISTKAHAVDDASENSVSGSVGDVLGLASYASDEEDEEIQHPGNLQTKGSSKHLQSSLAKNLEGHSTLQNGSSNEARVEQCNDSSELKADGTGSRSPVFATVNAESNGAVGELVTSDNQRSSKKFSSVTEEESRHGFDSLKSKSVAEKERSGEFLITTSPENDRSRTSNIKNRPDKNGHENKRSSTPKDDTHSESLKERSRKRGDEGNRRQEERYKRDEKTDYHDGSKDRRKEKGRTDEKTKDSESRKRRSPGDGYEGVSHAGNDKRTRDKEDTEDKRRDKAREEKKERSRHNNVSDSGSRHKRHRSPSVDGRDRESKKKSAVGHENDYSDQSSDESRRRSRHSKRHKSPSPTRSRKRQVLRSPHSKHSKRRHSPYSSLETTRGKRSSSRSRSPAHRRR